MTLTRDELEFLSAWAREEWEAACDGLPAHRLQFAHGVSGAQSIAFIKARTEGEGKKDQEILGAAVNPQPRWPWLTPEAFDGRLAEASRWQTDRATLTARRAGTHPAKAVQSSTNDTT
jgi:hypothetical protein